MWLVDLGWSKRRDNCALCPCERKMFLRTLSLAISNVADRTRVIFWHILKASFFFSVCKSWQRLHLAIRGVMHLFRFSGVWLNLFSIVNCQQDPISWRKMTLLHFFIYCVFKMTQADLIFLNRRPPTGYTLLPGFCEHWKSLCRGQQ